MHYSVRPSIIATFFLFLSIMEMQAIPTRFRCMWRDDPSTSMVIGWDQVTGSNPTFYFGEEDKGRMVNFYQRSKRPDMIINAKGMSNNFVRLFGLKPNTVYYFVIKDSEGISERYSFKTAPASPNIPLSLIAGGDSRNDRVARCRANRLVGKLRPHAVIFAGDMTGGDTSPEWKNWFDDWQLTFGKDGRIHPIIVARGNHEKSNKVLEALFDLPHPEAYYSLVLGGSLIKVFTLNSMDPVNGPQLPWLERELKSSNYVTWRFVQYHNAMRPHTSEKPDRNDIFMNWAPLFHKYKVNVVMESDAHVVKCTYPIRPSKGKGSEAGFIRDDKDGTVYIGEGCWGAPLRINDDEKVWTRASGSFNQFKWLWVTEDRIEIRTVMTDSEPRVPDLGNDHVFTVPASLRLWQFNNTDVVFVRNGKATQKLTGNNKGNGAGKRSWDSFPELFPDAAGKVRIQYSLKDHCDIIIQLVDSDMRPISKAALKNQKPGNYEKDMDTSKMEKGRYLLVIRSGKNVIKEYQILKP
ncbi:MAG: metallophosphoesterase family protein [Saprospiraceae bacterium]|nr:metallophosphoesterase family protein [Saprospiraceae bacterium]